MEDFEVDQSSSKSDNKNKIAFLTSKGFKRSITLVIILTIFSIIYTFFNKLPASSLETIIEKIFKKMMSDMSKDELQNIVSLSKSSNVSV